MKCIDFHVHPFRDAAHNLCMYPGTYDITIKESKKQLEAAGISHICGSVLHRDHKKDSFQDIKDLNREALDIWEILGDFYTPGFHIHPGYVKESCDEIEYMYKKGVRLIGELVPNCHGWQGIPEKNLFEILDVAVQYNMVLSIHTPTEWSVKKIAEKFPKLAVVAAHPGDRQRVAEHIELMKDCPNLYLDLSGTGMHRFGILRRLVETVGAEKVLFGTDYPVSNPRMYVEAFYGEDISQEERDLIFYKNAERLLKI